MIVVFTGPTLAAADAAAVLDAVYRPPAAQGDVYRAAEKRPWGIGIIDGYFEHVPAVWHKEILWAMSRGVHVFGAASIGALRAVELESYGMVGVGRVFEAFRDGQLEDDDEVALTHTPVGGGYRAFSEAMVNIRATLRQAVAEDVLLSETAEVMAGIAKALFYPRRGYATILRLALEAGLPAPALADFEAWLETGRVDQKRLDALAMLRAMDARRVAEPGPKKVCFTFQHTEIWEHSLHPREGSGESGSGR